MSDLTRVLYRQTELPVLQNRTYASEIEARTCPRGDITLVEDLRTGLCWNSSFELGLVVYDRHYQNEQATSATFRTHLDRVTSKVCELLGRESLVEIGCGKGFFLELLIGRGVDVIGFDPTYEGVNTKIERQFFGPETKIKAKGLILRHVLEHILDPFTFLSNIRDANGGGGLIYIEVPCLDWILRKRAWFDIFYEHVNYFRLSDFTRMFGHVVEMGRVFGGQYLSVYADLGTLRSPRYDAADRIVFPGDFAMGLSGASATQLVGKVVWGGSSKGVIYSLLRERAGHPVRQVIDINPAKQGRHLPVTGLLVQSPEDGLRDVAPGSIINVMNSNYIEEIRALTNNAFTYVGVDYA